VLIDYMQCGDFLIPNIVLSDPPRELTEPITKYGAMRRSFLKTHRPFEYSALLLSERLFPHLREVQQAAHDMLETIMSDMLVLRPPPDKAENGIEWAMHMAEVHRISETMMLNKVVYA